MRVTYRYFRPMTVVFARGFGPYAKSAPAAWQTMSDWLDRRHMRTRVKQVYGYFHDNPRQTAPELLRYDACVPACFGVVADLEAGIASQTLPGGAFAVYTHVGSYGETGHLFSILHRDVVPRRGLCLDYDRPFLAIHLNDPRVTREVHRRTELCVPVLPVRMPLSSNDDEAANAQHRAIAVRT